MPIDSLFGFRFAPVYLVLTCTVISWTGCASFSHRPTADHVVRARQLSMQATDAMQNGRWEDAETLFREALETFPADDSTHSQYAETLWRRGATDEAVRHMEQAVQLSGGDPQRRVQLGNMYLARRDLQAARAQANQALMADRQLAGAWALRADMLECEGQHQSALACYHRCLAYQPHFPQVQMAVARIYQRQQRHQRVLATLQTLAAGYPPGEVPVEVLTMQGVTLKSMGRLEDAVEVLTTAAASTTASADLLFQLAEAHLLTGNTSSARVAVLEALQREPRHPACLRLKFELDRRQQEIADARVTAGR
jgi:Tfp pilus assembly protein PilF